MNHLVTNLSDNTASMSKTGGKGANLTWLCRAGFPVPPGFILTTAAYHAFVEANSLHEPINAAWKTLNPRDPDSFARAADAIRQAFLAGVLPEEVHTAVAQVFMNLNAPAVAVRSSATAEDLPEASFAGQQDTYLNVQTLDGLVTAVINCWASLWTARAMAYRFRQGIMPHAVALAVVVQTMIPADVAGVLFTLNPISGANDELLVNATWGLGEALVGGKVNPDSYLLDKATGAIKQTTINDKTVMTVPTDQGTQETAVPDAQRRTPTLSAQHAHTLARLGRDIEAYFGGPQDIEWAIAGDQVLILQARPVTAVSTAPPTLDADEWPPIHSLTHPFDRWTQADVGERWPEAVTPFTWSTWASMINENMAHSFGRLRNPTFKQIQWARRAYGRVYLNEGALIYAFNRGFGYPISMIEASLQNPELATPDERRWRIGPALASLPLSLRILIESERNATRFEQEFPQIERWVDEFMTREFQGVIDAKLWQEAFSVWRPRLITYMNYHASVLSLTMTAFNAMRGLLGKWLGDESLVYDLIGGLNGIITAEIVPTLWQMVAQLRAADLADLVLQHQPTAVIAELWRHPASRPFLDDLARFLQRHGHRCVTEAEWLHPRWLEAPEQVMTTIATYLRTGDAPNLAAIEAQLVERRLATTARIEAQLDPVRRAYFRWGLRRLQRLIRLRDNGQHYVVRLALPMRRLFDTLAQRWANRSWIATRNDFYFLTMNEVEQVIWAGSPKETRLDLLALIQARRQAYDYWLTQPLIDVLDAEGRPWVGKTAVSTHDRHTLRGIPASAGQVTGPARLVNTPAEAARLQPGDILVTRATDPGWTPAFAVISGLVLEIGGQLSHGAIVAREYGLPAIVNAPQAMQRITDGQIITIDGGTGVVSLQPAGGE